MSIDVAYQSIVSRTPTTTCAPDRCEPRRRVPTQPIGPSKESLPLPSSTNCAGPTAKVSSSTLQECCAFIARHCKPKQKLNGSGGIRTHASEETGALNQRLRPLGHATRWSFNSFQGRDTEILLRYKKLTENTTWCTA